MTDVIARAAFVTIVTCAILVLSGLHLSGAAGVFIGIFLSTFVYRVIKHGFKP